MPRPEGVLSMKARSLFARKHRRFVAISQGGLSTFKLQKPEDIAVLETRKDLPFDYVEGVRLDGSRFVVKRRKPWRSDVVFYCATAPAARAWAEAPRSRLDAFRNKARVQFPPLNSTLGPNLRASRPELPPLPAAVAGAAESGAGGRGRVVAGRGVRNVVCCMRRRSWRRVSERRYAGPSAYEGEGRIIIAGSFPPVQRLSCP